MSSHPSILADVLILTGDQRKKLMQISLFLFQPFNSIFPSGSVSLRDRARVCVRVCVSMVSGHCLSVVVLFTFSTIHPAIRLSCYPPMRPPMRPPIHSLLQSPSYILKSLIFASSTHHIHPSVHPWYTNLA